MRRRSLPCLVLVALAGGAVCAAAAGAQRLVPPRAASFVSLWPRGGGGSLAIEQFSLRSGAPLATLIREPGFGGQVSSPHPDGRGDLWFTTTIGPRCSSNVAGCGPVLDTCRSTVRRLDPATGGLATVTSFP